MSNTITPELLKILCCPESHQPLKPADKELLDRLNEDIRSGKAKNRAGQPVSETITQGLLREDGLFLYPYRNNIPVLLIDEALPVKS
ncbi:MAG: hypothetical protein ACO34E_00300 [Limisphaerales bacterium]|jgi:uncharacterized protein YbaR (Trm112 family)